MQMSIAEFYEWRNQALAVIEQESKEMKKNG
jgi:hypothetical protein